MKKILSVLLVALIFMGLVSCVRKIEGEVTDAKETVADSKNFFKTDEKMYEINSKHCSVQFPEKWKDIVETQITETSECYKITFYALLNNNKIPLYALVFGSGAEGYLLGRVNTEKGEQDVFLIDMTAEYSGGLSEADAAIYNEMSGGVNHIISKLVYDNGMIVS